MAWNRKVYTADGSFVVPAGVKEVVLFGFGGGGGGGSGATTYAGGGATRDTGGSGGGGAVPSVQRATVTPGASVTVTVGDGGAGGVARTSDNQDGAAGSPGEDSAFGSYKWCGAGTGVGGSQGVAGGTAVYRPGGRPSRFSPISVDDIGATGEPHDVFGFGGCGANTHGESALMQGLPQACGIGVVLSSRGADGADGSGYFGGGGGGGGGGGWGSGGGAGGAGGDAGPASPSPGGDGTAGTAGGANTGAGGGGGGGAGGGMSASGDSGAGGTGGSGLVVVYWWT